MSDLDEQLRDILAELRDGQRALGSGLAALHLETSSRLTRLEEQQSRARADDAEIKQRLERVESAEHVSVEWMKKVEQRAERNAERIEWLAQQRGVLVGMAAAAAWLLGLLVSAVKAWLPAMTGK